MRGKLSRIERSLGIFGVILVIAGGAMVLKSRPYFGGGGVISGLEKLGKTYLVGENRIHKEKKDMERYLHPCIK